MAKKAFSNAKASQGGPIALALQSAAEVGWRMEKPFTIINGEGEEIDLWSDSPGMVRQKYVTAYRNQQKRAW